MATAPDLPRLVELAAAAADELRGERGGALWALREARQPLEPSLAATLADPDQLLLAGTLDEVVVGFAAAHVEALADGAPLGVVDELYVEPEARDVGVGEALMDAVLAWAAERRCRGVDAAVLPGMRGSKNFFERYGLTARLIVVHRSLA